MPTFLCKIGTADGRIVERSFADTTPEQLRQILTAQGFEIFGVRRQRPSLAWPGNPRHQKVTGRRFLSFNQEMLVLLRSGLPVFQALETQIEQMEVGAFRTALNELREEIRGGSALSEAFARFPQFFSPLYVAAVKAGEKTGDLPATLARFLAYQKRVEAIRAKVRSASFYPLLLTFAAAVVVIFLMMFVVPCFTEIYADANVELPLMTRLLIGGSSVALHFWYLLPLVLVGGYLLLKAYLRSPQGRLQLDRLLLQLPFFGKLRIAYGLSGFCRTLGTVVASGTPLVEAMQMSHGTLNSLSLERETREAIRRVEEGEQLSEACKQTGFFPPLALRMITIGETSASLTEMLQEVADFYEAEVEERLTRLTTMIEPVLMMTMGLLIAFIIVAMYIPIFQLAGTVN